MVLLSASCGSEPKGVPAPDQFKDSNLHAVHVGLEDAARPEAALGRIVAARVTDGARHVVVLDFAAPFVKVFGHDGRFRTAFLRNGGGPGEARAPTALAVSGDSLVLVADPGRGVMVFDLQGRLRSQAPVPGILALSAAAPCPGEWLLYGPRAGGGGVGAASWLHRVRFTGPNAVEVRSTLSDSVVGRLSAGLPYGLVAHGGGAVVRHTLGTRPRVLHLRCAGGEPRVLDQGEPRTAPPSSPAGNGSVRTSVPRGMRAPGGVAALDEGVIFAEKVHVGDGADRLDLTLLSGGSARKLSIAGDYVLLDSRPDVGVLVSTSDPVPQAFLVKPRDFVSMFPAR
jgi:hypothetical protein